jgi:hypothetical protein
MQLARRLSLGMAIAIPLVAIGYPAMQVSLAESPVLLAQSVWKTFTSREDNFSILMPGNPQPVRASINFDYPGQGNISMNVRGFVASQYENKAQYSVMIAEFSPQTWGREMNSNQMLDEIQGRDFRNQIGHSRLLNRRNLRLNNYPGREIKRAIFLSGNNENYIVTKRAYIVRQRFYEVEVLMSADLENRLARSSTGFLNSFRLLTR